MKNILLILLLLVTISFSQSIYGKVESITPIVSPVLPFICSTISGYDVTISTNSNEIIVLKTSYDERYKFIKPGYFIKGFMANGKFNLMKIFMKKG